MARKNPWLFNPRAKKLVKPHLRVTKKGVSWVEGFMHEYPSKLNEPLLLSKTFINLPFISL